MLHPNRARPMGVEPADIRALRMNVRFEVGSDALIYETVLKSSLTSDLQSSASTRSACSPASAFSLCDCGSSWCTCVFMGLQFLCCVCVGLYGFRVV